MRILEKLKPNSRVRGRDWNRLVRLLNKLAMITGGRGITVKNLPTGLAFSINRGQLGIPNFALAQVVAEGPSQEGMPTLVSHAYWVREVGFKDMAMYWDMVNSGRKMVCPTVLPDDPDLTVGGGIFQFIEGGFWEPAVNLAELGLPGSCPNLLTRPLDRAIPEDPDSDDTPQGDVTDKDDPDYIRLPVVQTWLTRTMDGQYSARVFSLFRPIVTEEWFLQTYDLDGNDCPDPTAWKRRFSLRLHETEGTP